MDDVCIANFALVEVEGFEAFEVLCFSPQPSVVAGDVVVKHDGDCGRSVYCVFAAKTRGYFK